MIITYFVDVVNQNTGLPAYGESPLPFLQECLHNRLHGERDGQNEQNLNAPEQMLFSCIQVVDIGDCADWLERQKYTRKNCR